MPRVISPPIHALDRLRQPLTSGERQVLEFFNARLAPEWEIYVQPHLNGLRPDFVLLHPRIGVAVFEVKDWSLNDAAYQVQKREDGTPVLMVNDHGEWRAIEQANPVEKILHYKQEIFDLYCPRLDQRAGRAVMTAGLIFPSTGDRRVREFFEPWLRRHREIVQYPGRHPVTGMEAIDGGRIDQVFPEHNRGLSKIMNETLARDLRSWLVEPDFALAQREPLDMDKNQNNLVTSRTDTGYRRIKGPAGSGKSLVLAARAVELANEGKDVLVVNYTITLPHYLRDLAARCHRNGEGRGSITWLNFHAWCKRVCIQAGFKKEYDNLFAEIRSAERREPDKKNNGLKEIMDHRIPDLVDRIISRNLGHPDTIYDAVLVDEAQDFQLKWWNLLRKVCRQGGEKLAAP